MEAGDIDQLSDGGFAWCSLGLGFTACTEKHNNNHNTTRTIQQRRRTAITKAPKYGNSKQIQ